MKVTVNFVVLVAIALIGETVPVKARINAVCLQPKVVGFCKAAFPRFYFDSVQSSCQPFIFGGCGGNRNNFESLGDCEQRCSGSRRRSGVCSLPVETGPCEASIRKWYYDAQTKRCRQFSYGGCHGNANRFNSARRCKRRCRGQ